MKTIPFVFVPPRTPTTLTYSPYLAARNYILNELPKYRSSVSPFAAIFAAMKTDSSLEHYTKKYIHAMLRGLYDAHKQQKVS